MKLRVAMIIGLMLFFSPLVAKEYELSTAVSGVVYQVNVKVGEKVKKDQLLLILDQEVFKAEMAEAEKVLHSAQLHRDEAKKELERAEELYERTVLSDHELNAAKAEFAKMDALLAVAESQKQKAAYALKYSQIVAPFGGKVQKIYAWPGMVVNNSVKTTILLTIKE